MKTPVKLAVTTAALALLLTGCGANDLASVKVEDQGENKAPSVSFDTPITVDEPTSRIISEGEGESIEEGDSVLIRAALFDGADESSLGDNYGQAPIVIAVDETLKKKQPEVYELLKGAKVGSTFAYAQAPEEKQGGSASQGDAASTVEIYHVSSKLLKKAQGEEVPVDPSLPKVTIEESGPKIEIPEDRKDEQPTELVSQNLINGDGEEIGAEDTVYVQYSGVRWATGEQFDSNWNSAPVGFSLNQVIQGWTEGLKGHHVGDRVELVIPAEKAYGTAEELGENAQQPAGALVFVVDILGRVDPVSTSKPSAEDSPAPEESAAPQETKSE